MTSASGRARRSRPSSPTRLGLGLGFGLGLGLGLGLTLTLTPYPLTGAAEQLARLDALPHAHAHGLPGQVIVARVEPGRVTHRHVVRPRAVLLRLAAVREAVGRRSHLTGARGEHLVKDEASTLVKDAHAWARALARGSERVLGSEHRRADRKQKVVRKSELVGVRGTVARLATRSWQAAATQQAAHVVGWLDAVREPPVLLDLGTHPTPRSKCTRRAHLAKFGEVATELKASCNISF